MNKTDNTQVATKADIQGLRTEFQGLRTEFKRTEKSLRGEILRVEEKVENLEEGQKDIKATLVKLQNTLDGFVGTVDNLRTENEVGAHQTRELEKRVTKLESSSHAV